MDLEQGLKAHLIERVAAPIPVDLATRLASGLEPRRRVGRPASGRHVLAMGSLAAVLVAALLIFEVATLTPTHSGGPTLTIGAPTGTTAVTPTPSSTAPSSTLLSHPTGSTDVILSLRFQVQGSESIAASMRALIQQTVFVMYGDGTAIYGPSRMSLALRMGSSQFTRLTSRLDPEEVDAVLRFALDDSHLREAHSYPMRTDPNSLAEFFVDADGVTKGLDVTDPSAIDPTLSPSDQGIRTALSKLVTYLESFADSTIAHGPDGRSLQTPYRADRYLAVLDDERTGILKPPYPWGATSLGPWPWPDVLPSAFRVDSTAARTLVITPEQYDKLAALRTAYLTGVAVRGPQGGNYLISVRPLLPGEVPPP